MTLEQYDPKNWTHEWFALQWFLNLRSEPEEFNNLLGKSLQMLTPFLTWLAVTVSMVFVKDETGIWGAVWVAPEMSGAYFGAWLRKDKRATIGALRFIRQAYAFAFDNYECVVGVTKQEKLHDLHLALGYEYMGELPGWFDGSTARVYKLTKENFYERRGRENKHIVAADEQRVRAQSDAPVQPESADDTGAVGADDLGAANGRSEREHPVNQRQRRKLKRSLQSDTGRLETATGAVGSER